MLKAVFFKSIRRHLPCKVQKQPNSKKRNQRLLRPCHISANPAQSYKTTSASFNPISTLYPTSSLFPSSKRLQSFRNLANSGLIGKPKECCSHLSPLARALNQGLDQPCIMPTHIRVLIQLKKAMPCLEAFRAVRQRGLQPKLVALLKKTKYVLVSHTVNSSRQLSYLHLVT